MTEQYADLIREVAGLREENRHLVKRLIAKDDLIAGLRKRPVVHAVFGYPITHPGTRELLGVYSTAERANAWFDAQDEEVRKNLGVVDIELDVPPSDDFWKKPQTA